MFTQKRNANKLSLQVLSDFKSPEAYIEGQNRQGDINLHFDNIVFHYLYEHCIKLCMVFYSLATMKLHVLDACIPGASQSHTHCCCIITLRYVILQGYVRV